jgi:hypothetical protein
MVASASNRPISGVEIAGRGVGQASWERFAAEGLGLNARFHHDTDLSVRGAAMLAMALDGVDVVEASARLIDDTHEIDATAHSESVAYAELERYRRATDLALQWRTFTHSTKETK